MANNKNVSARIRFNADKMLPKIKKCLEKKDPNQFKVYPAVELETGIIVATTGHVFVAHKLKDYRFSPSDGAMLGDILLLPKEVLAMKGTITVQVMIDEGCPVVTATDERGTTGEVRQTSRFPRWRSIIPRITGHSIAVDAKAWDAALKNLLPKLTNPCYPIRVYGEQKSKHISLGYYNDDTDETGNMDVPAEVPFKFFISLNGKRLRDMLAFEPTAMRFVESTRAVFFLNEETLLLQMPLLYDSDLHCSVDKRYYDSFDLDKWVGAEQGEIVVDNREQSTVKPEPTLAERLRAVLLRQNFRKAA